MVLGSFGKSQKMSYIRDTYGRKTMVAIYFVRSIKQKPLGPMFPHTIIDTFVVRYYSETKINIINTVIQARKLIVINQQTASDR